MSNILVTDDEHDVVEFISTILSQQGHSVYGAYTAWEAMTQLTIQKNIDIAIIDLVMPKVHGLELIKEIKRVKPEIKIIIISGWLADEELKGIMRYGIYGYLKKPFHRQELIDSIDRARNNQALKFFELFI